MSINFYVSAKKWTAESTIDKKSKNYFKSWAKTIRARVNFLADAIVNLVLIPFNFFLVFFGLPKAIYTWGLEVSKVDAINLVPKPNGIEGDFKGSKRWHTEFIKQTRTTAPQEAQ